MGEWQPMETAPKDGRPVWARGNNWGEAKNGQHVTWAYWNGEEWREPGPMAETTLTYLTEWMPEPPKP